jgi:hypothetical protein
MRDFGAKGDGKTDDTAALTHAIQRCDGQIVFPRGDYLITSSLHIPLESHGRLSIEGTGGTAKLIMAGSGPALSLLGTHRKSALPEHFLPGVWQKERMPTIRGLEIAGQHPQADGMRIEGAMQPTLQNLLIRRCRHGIHLLNRDRNVIISDCHIYDNSGIGVFLDRVNLHQINIHGNHISYCKQGGIRIAGSEIRNLQICSNDIEYNYDLKAETSADILFDCREGTVREGTVVGNTIQAMPSPNGANIRMIGAGKDNANAVGMFAISGNLIGSQQALVHLQACRGVVVSSNCLYSGLNHALLAEDAEHLVIGPNSIDHNSDYQGKSTDLLLLRDCRNVNINGLLLQHTRAPNIEAPASLELRNCHTINVTGSQVINARVRGIAVRGSKQIRIADCTIRGRKDDPTYRHAIDVDEASSQVMVTNNFLGKGSDGELQLPKEAGSAAGNVSI